MKCFLNCAGDHTLIPGKRNIFFTIALQTLTIIKFQHVRA